MVRTGYKVKTGNKGMNIFRRMSAVIFLVFFTSFECNAEGKDAASILQLSKDLRVEYGVSRLKERLHRQDVPALQKLVVGFKSDPGAKQYLNDTEYNHKAISTAEGFLVKRINDAGQDTIIIVGADPKGAMYGCLELAEKLRITGYDKIPPFYASIPVMKLRSYDFAYPTFVKGCSWNDNPYAAKRLATWFYNKEKIIPFLDKLAEAKFNAMKIDGTHPFPALVPIPGYPEAIKDVVEETPLTVDKLEKERIPYLRWLFAECQRRGITPYISFFNVWAPQSVMNVHGIDREGKENYHTQYPEPAMAAYTKAAVKAFSDAYGDLAGLFIWNMESIPQGSGQLQNKWLRENIIGALFESKNRPRCILAPFTNALTESDGRASMEEILKSYPQLEYFSCDDDGENTIAPDLDSVYLDLFKAYKGFGGLAGGIVNSNLGGWGSGNIEPYPWFSTDFLKRRLKFLESRGIIGSTSFPMRGEWYPDYYERDWLWIRGLGEFLWNGSDLHVEYFKDLVKDRYECDGDAAEAILNAYTKSSEIPVIFASQFCYFTCTLRYQFGAPIEYGIWPGDLHLAVPGMLLADSPYNDLGALWIKPHPDLTVRKKLVDIVEYVQSNQDAEITPDRLAQMLEVDANACLQSITVVVPDIKQRKGEFDELLLNMQAYHYMGLHFSEKIKAVLSMLRYLKTGDKKLYDAGKQHLEKSLEYFLEQRAISQKVYPDPDRNCIFQVAVPSIPIDWDSIVPLLKDEIANYDKYLVRCSVHLIADRKNTAGPGSLRDLYRRITPGTVNIWHTWWGKDPNTYWNNDDNMKRYWSRWNKAAMMPLMPTREGMVPVNPNGM